VIASVWVVPAHQPLTVRNVFSTPASIHTELVPVICTGQATAVKTTSESVTNSVTAATAHLTESVTTVYHTPHVTSTVNAIVMNSG